MRTTLEAAKVIARRDFVATVWSKTFALFLAGPLLIIGLSVLFGNLGERMARQDTHPTVAVIGTAAEFRAIGEARERLNPAFGERRLPDLVHAEPDYEIEGQVGDLLASHAQPVVAVLTGGIERPRLTGAIEADGSVRRHMSLILDEARQRRALGENAASAPFQVELRQVEQAAGSTAAARAGTARAGQFLVFTLTLVLAGMLLSNLTEEKSNRVIEVLAASVPLDAVFLGKLVAMLGVSLAGIAVWLGGALLALQIWPMEGGSLPEPAVGWPAFVLLTLVYYSANYMLLGAVFLGIGAQASSIREVQTLSMPVTIVQFLLFLFASMAVGPFNSLLGIGAAVFPYSSPLAMVARAAQTPELWTHALALLWQAAWIWLTIKLTASLFRTNVMKSGSGGGETARA